MRKGHPASVGFLGRREDNSVSPSCTSNPGSVQDGKQLLVVLRCKSRLSEWAMIISKRWAYKPGSRTPSFPFFFPHDPDIYFIQQTANIKQKYEPCRLQRKNLRDRNKGCQCGGENNGPRDSHALTLGPGKHFSWKRLAGVAK